MRPTWLVTLATMPFGMAAGVHALHAVRPDVPLLAMAALLVGYLLLDRLGHTDQSWARAHPSLPAAPFGLLAGLTEGALNVAGPVLPMFFLLVDLPVATTIVVLGWLFIAGKVKATLAAMAAWLVLRAAIGGAS